MKTVALISQKGGVGKTTLATCLATYAQGLGKTSVVFDLDPQASATFWKDTRDNSGQDSDREVAVLAIPPARLNKSLEVASGEGSSFAFIDAPPLAKDIAFEAAQFADFILIPTKPAVLDIMSMTKTLELVAHYNKPSAVVLSICPAKGREVRDTVETIKKLGAEVAPVHVHNRIAYSRAQQTGLSAHELEPKGKAAQEIKELYKYVCMHV